MRDFYIDYMSNLWYYIIVIYSNIIKWGVYHEISNYQKQKW